LYTWNIQKNLKQQPTKNAGPDDPDTFITDEWKRQDTSPVMSVIVQSTKSQIICKAINTHNTLLFKNLKYSKALRGKESNNTQ